MISSKQRKFISWIIGVCILAFATYQTRDQILHPPVTKVIYDKSIVTRQGELIKVAEAIDGDTIILANGDHLRYIGIDTPEEFDPRKPVQCFALQAAAKNRELVEGKMIKFYKDVNETDKYGRWLGYVYLEDGTFVNEKLVREGYAFSYPYVPDISKTEIFRMAEEYARTNKLGLWGGECSITILKGGREQTNDLNK